MLTIATRKTGGLIQILEALELKGQLEGEALCPSEDCGLPLEPVSAFVRVGSIPVRAFFRHKRGAASLRPCWGAKGEGGLHFAAKLHLRAEFQALCSRGGMLVVAQPCLRCATGIEHEALHTKPGDVVTIEHWLDPRHTLKPDVVVSRDGKPLLTLEVRASHPVSARKIAALTAAGAQMIEVEAWALLGTKTSPAWSPSIPLPLKRAVLPVARQLCGACQAAQDHEAACARETEERRQREVEEQRQRAEQRGREQQGAWAREAQWARDREVQERAQAAARWAETERARRSAAQAQGAVVLKHALPTAFPTVGVVAHCFLDLCQGGGVRIELELVLERLDDENALLRERRDNRILQEWQGKTVSDTQWLLQQARAAASSTYKAEREAGTTLDPYRGFQPGPMPNGLLYPNNYWWDTHGERWVRARLQHRLANEMGISEREVDARLPPEHFHRIIVRFSATTAALPAYEPVGDATFEKYLGLRR